MTHEAARERLLELACGELFGREAARVEAHAAGCEACRAELAELRETRRLMAGLEEIPAPERGEAELLAAARSAAAARPRPWRVPAWFLGASAVAAALVTVTAVSYRLLTTAPAQREDPEALLGRATAPAAAQSGQTPGDVASKHAADPGAAPASGKPSQPAPARAPERPAPASAPSAGPGAAAPAPRPKATALEADAAMRKDETRRVAEEVAPSLGVEGSRGTETSVGVSEARAASAPTRTAGPRAAAAVARAPAEAGGGDAVARWQGLRAGGDLRREVVTFPDCPGESWREVDTDPRGRVVRYVRHGLAGGVPFEAELYYTDDGALGAVRYREAHGAWRELRLLGAPGPAPHVPAPALDPAHAGHAAASAPPRCRF